MKTKLKATELVVIASMLFGLFFGAGNLIFPIRMGQLAGANMWVAFLGLLITGVGLPLLGVASIGISRSDGLIELSGKVSRGYSIFFTCALYLTIGPFFAIPRCGAVSFTIGMQNMLGEGAYTSGVLVVFSLLFFLAVLVLSLNPGEILTWVGKVLTPLFLIFLGALVAAALIHPMGSISEMTASGGYATSPFVTGFLEGYNTMDALASLAFGIVVITVIRDLGVKEPGAVAAHTVKAGVFSCLFMGLIYLAVAVVGAQTGILYADCKDGGEIFARVAEHYFGKPGAILLAIMVTFACMKTAVGLVTSCAETFTKMFPKAFSYRVWVVIFCLVSFLFANLGLDAIIAYSIPVLMFLYPLAITLILLGLFGNLFHHSRVVYGFVTGFTLFAAIFDLLGALPADTIALLHVQPVIDFAKAYLPLYTNGLGWVVPAAVGTVVGIVVMLLTDKKKVAA